MSACGVEREVRVRIRVESPPAGVAFAVQQGRDGLVAPVARAADELCFEVPLRLLPSRADGSPNFGGPCAQGPRDARFVYVNSGTMAGQAGSCWSRRAKVQLGGIPAELVANALAVPGRLLETRIAGSAGDGGPACATVPLLGGWRVTAG